MLDFYGKKYKRSSEGIRWGLVKYIKDLNYELQGYCYHRAVTQYMEHKNVNVEIEFCLLFASKETFD